MMKQAKHVIIGGPCTGKSSTIQEIAKLGYSVVDESARQIISEEQQKFNGVLPWINLQEFQRKVLKRQINLENMINSEAVFLDRGILDGIAYCRLDGQKPLPEMIDLMQTHRYDSIFLLEPLPFYSKDNQRKETPEQARIIHDAIAQVYSEAGYKLIPVPFLSPQERAKYIVNKTLEGKI